MALLFADSFDHYSAADSVLKWDIGAVPIANVGRRGTQGANWAQGAAARNIGNQTHVVVGVAVFPTFSDLLTATVQHQGTPVANTLTSKCYVIGFGYQGIAQIGLAFTNDGALHVIRGSAFDLTDGSGGVNILASSAPGVLPLTGWSYLEAKILAATDATGSVEVRVNGTAVITQTNVITVRPTGGLPAVYSQLYIGGASFGGDLAGVGWFGRLDDLYLFNTSGATNNDFVGDVRVDYLQPDGAGFVSGSTIGGTSPAPSRWQSVDDLLPDGEATYVALPVIGDADSYTHEDLPFDEAVVFGVQGIVAARKSDAGLAGIRHTQRVDALDDEGGTHYPAGGEFSYFTTPFDESANGPWTLEKLNASEFGVKRVAP